MPNASTILCIGLMIAQIEGKPRFKKGKKQLIAIAPLWTAMITCTVAIPLISLHNHPPLIVYDEDKRMYYECLQKYDETEKLNPLYELVLKRKSSRNGDGFFNFVGKEL